MISPVPLPSFPFSGSNVLHIIVLIHVEVKEKCYVVNEEDVWHSTKLECLCCRIVEKNRDMKN